MPGFGVTAWILGPYRTYILKKLNWFLIKFRTFKKGPINLNLFFTQKIQFHFIEMWFNIDVLSVFHSKLWENEPSKL